MRTFHVLLGQLESANLSCPGFADGMQPPHHDTIRTIFQGTGRSLTIESTKIPDSGRSSCNCQHWMQITSYLLFSFQVSLPPGIPNSKACYPCGFPPISLLGSSNYAACHAAVLFDLQRPGTQHADAGVSWGHGPSGCTSCVSPIKAVTK